MIRDVKGLIARLDRYLNCPWEVREHPSEKVIFSSHRNYPEREREQGEQNAPEREKNLCQDPAGEAKYLRR